MQKKYGFEIGRKEGLEKGRQEGIEKGIQEGIEKGIQEGIEKGIEQGIEEGMQKARYQMTLKLLAEGMPLEKIATLTGLSLAQVQQAETNAAR